MAIEDLQRGGQQRFFGVVFVLLIFLTLTILFLGFSRKPISIAPEVSLSRPPKPEINFEIFQETLVKELQPIEGISLPAERGRENPFLPY